MTGSSLRAGLRHTDTSTEDLDFIGVETAKDRVLTYIETTLGHIVQEIQVRPHGRPSITLKRIKDVETSINPVTQQVGRQILDREVTYCFPGKNKDEAWRFACMAKILAEICVAIKTGVTVTKRDIYYRDPLLYKQQATVDRYVDDIAYTCRATRKDLNVFMSQIYAMTNKLESEEEANDSLKTASSKGLFAGLNLTRPTLGDVDEGFQAVPDFIINLAQSSLRHVRWILVIEKEATFRNLVEKSLHRSAVVGNGLLVTGKGYPDLTTRRFLRACLECDCWTYLQRPPIFGLFDCDRDGIAIMQTYRQGSIALAHEASSTIPEMEWLGMRLDDVVADAVIDEPLLPLTLTDRERIQAMMERQSNIADSIQQQCFSELQRMLVLNVKAEIQLLDDRPGGLVHWLEERIGRRPYLPSIDADPEDS